MRRSLAAAALVTLLGLVAGCGSSSSPSAGPGPASQVPRDWPLPKDPTAAAAQAGLPMLSREMLEVHYHAHLDVLVRGVTVTVPAGIGIDSAKRTISALHTHDTTGIVHIESDKDIPFTLGQLFTEWGQPLSGTKVGPVTVASGEQVRIYRNGAIVPGDPAALKFAQHDQIVVWVGPASAQQPTLRSSYTFPEGL